MSVFRNAFPEIPDAEIRMLISLADRRGLQQRGRVLVLPPIEQELGQIYGMKVVRKPITPQEPFIECRRESVERIGISEAYDNK